MIRSQSTRLLACLLAAAMLLGAGCAYYNTFYNAKASYREGLKLKEQNQNTQAKAKFDKAIEKSALVIKRWPKSQWVDDALFLVGASYYQESQYSKAVRELDQLKLAFPNSGLVPEGELYRGLSLLADKQYGTARVVLEGVMQKYPKYADDAAFNLAKSLVDRKETERATDSLAAFIERYPKSRFRRPAVKLLADGSFTLKRYADAEKWYELYARLSSDPKERALAKLKIASCRYEQGKYQEAVAEVLDVRGRYTELDDEANLLLGKALSETDKPAEALAAWVKVRGNSDFGAEAAFRIGKHHEEGADFEKARANYDTARTRRLDSDYGVLAVKRLALLDALAARSSGKKTGGDSLTPAEAAFLLAEVNNLNLGDYDKAMDLYQKVHDSFPDTDWAAKALFAKAWIIRNVKNDSAGAEPMLREVIAEYPETEYADESRRWLGLPVPKREKKKPETKVETPPAPPPIAAGEPGLEPGLEPPKPDEPAPGKPDEVAVAPEPEMSPHGARGPGRMPERPDRTRAEFGRGERQRPRPDTPGREKGEEQSGKTAGEQPKKESLPAGPASVVAPQGTEGVAPVTPPPAPSVDTATQPKPEKKTEPVRPAAGPQLEIAHFATDSWQIQATDTARLRANAESLKAHPDLKVVITGHCDPRASERYNKELGLKRAKAVKDFLVAAGVAGDRVAVRSEGKQRPISTKPDEYWLDRRAEFAYR